MTDSNVVSKPANKLAQGARKVVANPVVARFVVPVLVGTAVAITTHVLTNGVETKLNINQTPAPTEPTPEA